MTYISTGILNEVKPKKAQKYEEDLDDNLFRFESFNSGLKFATEAETEAFLDNKTELRKLKEEIRSLELQEEFLNKDAMVKRFHMQERIKMLKKRRSQCKTSLSAAHYNELRRLDRLGLLVWPRPKSSSSARNSLRIRAAERRLFKVPAPTSTLPTATALVSSSSAALSARSTLTCPATAATTKTSQAKDSAASASAATLLPGSPPIRRAQSAAVTTTRRRRSGSVFAGNASAATTLGGASSATATVAAATAADNANDIMLILGQTKKQRSIANFHELTAKEILEFQQTQSEQRSQHDQQHLTLHTVNAEIATAADQLNPFVGGGAGNVAGNVAGSVESAPADKVHRVTTVLPHRKQVNLYRQMYIADAFMVHMPAHPDQFNLAHFEIMRQSSAFTHVHQAASEQSERQPDEAAWPPVEHSEQSSAVVGGSVGGGGAGGGAIQRRSKTPRGSRSSIYNSGGTGRDARPGSAIRPFELNFQNVKMEMKSQPNKVAGVF